MKNLTLESLSIFVNAILPIKIGTSITCTANVQIICFQNKQDLYEISLEDYDVQNVVVMGVPVKEGYKEYQEVCKNLLGLGIDLNKSVAAVIDSFSEFELQNFAQEKVPFLKDKWAE